MLGICLRSTIVVSLMVMTSIAGSMSARAQDQPQERGVEIVTDAQFTANDLGVRPARVLD